MKIWKIISAAGIIAVGLLAFAGCASDPVAPQETYNVDAQSAEEWSLQAIAMISQMAVAVPMASQGDFSNLGPNKSDAAPVWDDQQMAWVLDQTVSFTEGDPPTSTGETRMSLWIQFRGAEGPLPSPLGATVMEYHEAAGMTVHSEHEQGTSDLDFDLATNMAEVNFGGSPGDDHIAEPYLYVGPWSPRQGDFWNESFGATMSYSDIDGPEDALGFFSEGLRLATE